MVKPTLRYLHSPDVQDLRAFHSSGAFCILVQALVGPEGFDSYESFDMLVCSPDWLRAELRTEAAIFGRHYVVMATFDAELLEKAIQDYLLRCAGETWDRVADKAARMGLWEFEDYKPT